ncbi:MAG TPA: hypothetical protein VLK84_26675 [Longimicrobium sp.]|nr:hypothetical protein [Longimicrobium sp.]
MAHDRKHNLNPADPPRHPAIQHDRKHNLNAELPAGGGDDHDGERKLSLSARSLLARGDALDGSEDGRRADADDQPDAGDEA